MMRSAVKHPVMPVHIKWMVRKDMPAVLEIEYRAFEFPWLEDAFIRHLRERNVIAMVAEADEHIVGFMVYELHKTQLQILDIAVHWNFRHLTVGTQMVKKLVSKLSHDRRSRVSVMVRETNLDGQLFFKAMGFRCENTIRGLYEETDEDAYEFTYRYGGCRGR